MPTEGASAQPAIATDAAAWQPTPIHILGARIIDTVVEVGNIVGFALQAVGWMVRRRLRMSVLIPCFHAIGVASVPVVAITGMFIGMVLAIQAFHQFNAIGMATKLGSVINISLVKELGPVLAATMLAGRVGTAMAAEMGTMRVTEQIDALSALGTNPIHYLVVPRFLACLLLIPLLTLMADFMGIIGGAVISTQMLGIDPYHYWLHSRAFVGIPDVASGLFKSFFFGASISLVSCHRGFHSKGGAEGVGRAATEAFVIAFVSILFIDFCLGILWNGTYRMLWPDAQNMI